MRTKVTLVLLFLNAALFLFIFKFERRWRTDEAALHVRHRVLTTEAADIRTIEVSGGAQSFRLEKREGGWFLTRPFDWPANANAVSRMTTELKLLESDVSFSVSDVQKNNLSLSDYGLDHPRLAVAFTSGGPDTTGRAPVATTLKVGDVSKDGRSLYLLSSDGSRIFVVGRELADSLQPTLDQLRSDDVLTIPVFEARLLSIETRAAPGLKVRLHLDGSRWSFESPIPARADKTATELAINGLDALRVRRFIENPGVPLPSADPELRISLEGDNRRETLFLGQPVDAAAAPGAREREYYAQREYSSQREGRSVLFTVMLPVGPDSLLQTLGDAQEALRDRHVLDFDPEAVSTIVLKAPGGQPDLTLQRLEAAAGSSAASWQIVLSGSATLPADTAAVQQLLGRLAGLSARAPGGFVSDAPELTDVEKWGFNRPARVITLDLAPGRGAPAAVSQIVLEIGQGQERDRAYARLQDQPSVYAIDPALLEETPLAPTAWRNRALPFLPAGAQVTGLKLTDLQGGRVLLDWTGGAGAPPPAAAPLLESLRNLRAQRFVQDSFSETVRDSGGEERPWRYRLDVALSLPAGAGGAQTAARTLLFTERVGGTEQLAGSRELGAVFTLEQPALDALWALTYGGRDPGSRK